MHSQLSTQYFYLLYCIKFRQIKTKRTIKKVTNLQIAYQNSNPLFKKNILHTVYLINENNEHCFMTNIGS